MPCVVGHGSVASCYLLPTTYWTRPTIAADRHLQVLSRNDPRLDVYALRREQGVHQVSLLPEEYVGVAFLELDGTERP